MEYDDNNMYNLKEWGQPAASLDQHGLSPIPGCINEDRWVTSCAEAPVGKEP